MKRLYGQLPYFPCLAVALIPASIPLAAGGPGQTSLAHRLQSLPFSVVDTPEHLMTVDVGVYFEHLYTVDSFKHMFTADFWLVHRWRDARNYTTLFENNSLVDVEDTPCDVPNQGHRLLRSVRSLAVPGTRYIELDHNSLSMFWQPDLHIRNLGSGQPKLYAELARFYEDGTFEFLRLLYAELGLSEPYYGAYPFDEQTLTVQIESLAHTTKQIQLNSIATFSGLAFEHTKEWPGWSPVEGAVKWTVEDRMPEYIYEAGNSHRCERRSRYHLDIKVKRHISAIVDNAIAPLVMQVVITWTAFFINVKVLMPRVAVSFISYLTLNNAAASMSEGLPPVSHSMFIYNFILFQRLMVVVGLFETACCWYITESLSTRVGSSLDKLSRVFVPLDYTLFTLVVFMLGPNGSDDTGAYEHMLNILVFATWANFGVVIVVGALWCFYCYRRLYQQMVGDPLKFHMSATHTPLDSNELAVFFHMFDVRTDGSLDGIIAIPHVVKYVIENADRPGLLDRCDDITAAVVAKIPNKRPMVNLEEFIAHFRSIMIEITHWCHEIVFEDLRRGQGTKMPQQAFDADTRANGGAKQTDIGKSSMPF